MNKQEFLEKLRAGLAGLPQADLEERLTFYSEMIDDRMEDSLSEEEAVAQVGTVEEVLQQILEETPLVKLVKEKVKPKRKLSATEITLLALGFPLWFSLLVSVFAVVLSLYISVWSVIISLWAAFGSVIACAVGFSVTGAIMVCSGNSLPGFASIGLGIASIGLSIFLYYGAKAATKGTLWLTKKMFLAIKKYFMKKEAV